MQRARQITTNRTSEVKICTEGERREKALDGRADQREGERGADQTPARGAAHFKLPLL